VAHSNVVTPKLSSIFVENIVNITRSGNPIPLRAFMRVPLLTLALIIVGSTGSQAQTYTVVHNFTGGGDGAAPYATLTFDAGGSLYGTTASGGGISGCGPAGCGTGEACVISALQVTSLAGRTGGGK